MKAQHAAIVLGASGSVGHALVQELLRVGSFAPVVTLVRRSQTVQLTMARYAQVQLREIIVSNMDPHTLEQATMEAAVGLQGHISGLSVLGVGAGTAKITVDVHRAIDVHLNAAFARGLKAAGNVEHLALMTAVGANPRAAATGLGAPGMARYLRVKGEAEEAVKAQGPAVVSAFRPALIIGSAHTPWLLAKIISAFSFMAPEKFRSVTVQQIAQAMAATCLQVPAQSGVYHYPEMTELSRQTFDHRNSAASPRHA